MSFNFISQHLQLCQQQALLRTRNNVQASTGRTITVDGKSYINFSSNNYLGLTQTKVHDTLEPIGSHSSPLVTGYQNAQIALEQYLCKQLGYQAAMLFSSGFSANSSVLKALFQDKSCAQQSAIFQDKLNHASLIDGALHSNAALIRFNHNDLRQLTTKLEKSKAKHKLIISEGVFSMDGDRAPIKELCRIAKQHNAWLMIDDAHGFGVLGDTGLGSCEALAQHNLPDILVITFGKAIASSGACVLGKQEFIDYMVQFNRDYIYSTALSPLIAQLTLKHIIEVRAAHHKRAALAANISLFKQLSKAQNIALMESNTAIQPIVLACAEATVLAAKQLKQRGFWLTAIRPPTVAHNTSRLRITLSSEHSEHDIRRFVQCLAEVLK